MISLREVVAEYKKKNAAIGHFNISDSNQLHAIARAAQESGLPVIVGLSEGERAFFPLSHARALTGLYQKDGLKIYLNADHTYSLEKAIEAIDQGVDSLVVDGAKLSFAENVRLLCEVTSYARSKASFFSFAPRVLVEGELGYIGQSSSVMEKLPEGAAITEEMMTKPEELQKLVHECAIDLAAPAVGNIHGIITSGQPKLSIDRINTLAQTAGVPLVLHGGSGSDDEEFRSVVKAGITIVHINTDIRVIYRDELKKALAGSEEVAPYKFLAPAMEKTKDYVKQKLQLFANP